MVNKFIEFIIHVEIKLNVCFQKIMNWAEEKALEFYDKNPDSRPPPPSTYYNSKKLVSFEQVKRNTIPEKLQHKIKLSEDSHFSNQVNISFSSVHVPTSIYERSELTNTFNCGKNI